MSGHVHGFQLSGRCVCGAVQGTERDKAVVAALEDTIAEAVGETHYAERALTGKVLDAIADSQWLAELIAERDHNRWAHEENQRLLRSAQAKLTILREFIHPDQGNVRDHMDAYEEPAGRCVDVTDIERIIK